MSCRTVSLFPPLCSLSLTHLCLVFPQTTSSNLMLPWTTSPRPWATLPSCTAMCRETRRPLCVGWRTTLQWLQRRGAFPTNRLHMALDCAFATWTPPTPATSSVWPPTATASSPPRESSLWNSVSFFLEQDVNDSLPCIKNIKYHSVRFMVELVMFSFWCWFVSLGNFNDIVSQCTIHSIVLSINKYVSAHKKWNPEQDFGVGWSEMRSAWSFCVALYCASSPRWQRVFIRGYGLFPICCIKKNSCSFFSRSAANPPVWKTFTVSLFSSSLPCTTSKHLHYWSLTRAVEEEERMHCLAKIVKSLGSKIQYVLIQQSS